MKQLLFLLFVFCVSLLKASNNQYFIKNYNPSENNENLSSDLYCISQTPNGVIILGTKNGIYTFDGVNTLYFPVAENNYVTACLAISDTKIYIGLTNGYGCLTKNNSGKYSLLLYRKEIEAEKIYKILEYNNNIVFCSKNKLIFFDKNDSFIQELTPLEQTSNNDYFHNVFSVSGALYIRQANKGLLQYDHNNLKLLPNGSHFKDVGIFNIRKRKDYLEILSVDNGFYFYKNGELSSLRAPFLNGVKVRGALELVDGKLCIYSANSGIFIMDSLYHQYAHISYQNGLASAKINNVISDFYGNIWTAGENGLHYVAYSSPVLLFNNSNGLPGKIHSVAIVDSSIYVGSSLGLYYCNKDLTSFKKLNEITSGVWEIKNFGKLLLIGTDNGLYYIKNSIIHKFNDNATQYIHVIDGFKEFYTVGKRGVFHYSANLALIDSIDLATKQIESISGCAIFTKPDTCQIYMSTYNSGSKNSGGIYSFVKIKQESYRTETISTHSKIGEIHSLNSNVYYSTCDTNYLIYNNKLIKSSGVLNKNANLQTSFKDSNLFVVAFGNRIGRIKSDSVFNFNDYSSISCQKVFHVNNLNNKIFFGTDKGLYVYFTDRKIDLDQSPRFTVSFIVKNNIYNTCDSAVYLKLPYNQNSFNILFTSTYLNNSIPAKFYWRILENGKEWTENNNQNTTSFFNVSPGKYTIEIKAKSVSGKESPIKKIGVTILSPWYKTIIAYLIYSLLLITFIVIGVRIYVWRLKKQNLVLENKVNERTRELIIKNQEIELQKEEINIAHREITDSIYYAQRIQAAVLPSHDFIKKIVNDFFVFYRPKNIVSGDFYWINKVDDTVVIIAADCTGHGVSGAFMSLLGITLLNEIILEKKIISPNDIIDNLRERLIKMLNPNDSKEVVRDGMDISVCTINENSNELLFAGANNKMFLVRTSTDEIIEIAADSMPAGYYEAMHPYNLQRVQFKKGDVAILCSDGYKDQFGGSKGKKFLVKRFKELLPSLCNDISESEQILEETFYNWKGDNEQIDDVMVLGFFLTTN